MKYLFCLCGNKLYFQNISSFVFCLNWQQWWRECAHHFLDSKYYQQHLLTLKVLIKQEMVLD